jgi:hypothetical protein
MINAQPNCWTRDLGGGTFAIWYPKLKTLKVRHINIITDRAETLREIEILPEMKVSEVEARINEVMEIIK